MAKRQRANKATKTVDQIVRNYQYSNVDDETMQKAWRARAAMKGMVPGLTAFANAVSVSFGGPPDVEVVIGSNPPRTDGKKIIMPPLMELGEKLDHVRAICSIRGEDDLMLCPACAQQDIVAGHFLHEISHKIAGSFEKVNDRSRTAAVKRALKSARQANPNSERYEKLEARVLRVADQTNDYMQIATAVSPFLQNVNNALEDARVNRRMYQARPGTQRMFTAKAGRIARDGFQLENGEMFKWNELPLNSQLTVGLLIIASGNGLESYLAEPVQEVLADPELRDLCGRAATAPSVKEIFELSFDVLEKCREHGYFLDDDDPEDEQPQEQESDASLDNDPEEDQEAGDGSESDDQSESSDDDAEASEEQDGGSGSPDDEPSTPDDESETTSGEESDEESDDSDAETSSGSDESESGEDDSESDDDTARSASTKRGTDDDSDADDEQDGDDFDEYSPSEEGGQSGNKDDADYDSLDESYWDDDDPDDDPDDDEPDMGTAEEAREALELFGEHDEDGNVDTDESDRDVAAVDLAVLQSEHFDAASSKVIQVRHHKFDEPHDEDAWDDRWFSRFARDVEDLTPGEAILTGSLLKLRRVFAENKRAKRSPHRSGRVNSSRLASVPAGNREVFTRTDRPGKRDYAVTIALDVSGSTSYGDRITTIKEMGMALGELMNRIGVKFSIYAHEGGIITAQSRTFAMDVYEVKTWQQPWDGRSKERLAKLVPAVNNLDGHAMEFFRKQLDAATATDRIILYVTDGAMPEANEREETPILKREIRTCQKKGYTVIGVGVDTESPKRHGLDTVVVHGHDDIGKVVKKLEEYLL